jgi:hypothetical protein
MKKKGFTSSTMFSYILGIVIIGLLLFFSSRFLGDLFTQEKTIEETQLKKSLQNSINLLSSKYGFSENKLFKGYSNYDEICFINTTDKTKLPTSFNNNYPLISNAIEAGDNVFLIGKEFYPIKVNKIQINHNVLCVPIKTGNFEINIEGRGDSSIISSVKGTEKEINIPEGEIKKETIVSSMDYTVELSIPKGVIINYPTESENKIKVIKKTEIQGLGQLNPVSEVFDFQPDGIIFNEKVPIKFTFNPKLINDVDKLKIYYFENSQWVELESEYEINLDTNTITGYTNHFTQFMAAEINSNRANGQPKEKTDIFLIMGQSNSVGYATDTPTITSVSSSYEIDYVGGTNNFLPLSYPTGVGSGNKYLSKKCGFSLSLAKKWYELSKTKSVFVFAGVPSTSLVESAPSIGGDWTDNNDNDGHYDFAVRVLNNAKQKINQNPNKEIGKTIIVWSQGENDALAGVSKTQYVSHMNTLYQKLKNDASFDAFFVVSIGYTKNQPNTNSVKFKEIMDAQIIFSNSKPDTILASKKATELTSACNQNVNSPNCGLIDNYHYKSRVYEELGRDIASNGWNFFINGKTNDETNLEPITQPITEPITQPNNEPNLILKCNGNENENKIIKFYDDYCFRCADVNGLNYWHNEFLLGRKTFFEIENAIDEACSGQNLLSKTKCERERFNGNLVGCSTDYAYLPNNNIKCTNECIEEVQGCVSVCPSASLNVCGSTIIDNCGNNCGVGSKCSRGTCTNNICKYQTNPILNCGDNSDGAKLYKTYANRCGENSGINYWNSNGANSGVFINSMKSYCLENYNTDNFDICNNKLLCGNDIYIPNSNWCKVN